MPRMVRYSIIQAANAEPATEPMVKQKQAVVERNTVRRRTKGIA
jgi:hypothetical protein